MAAQLRSRPRTSETLGAEVSRYMDAIPEDQKAPYAAALAVSAQATSSPVAGVFFFPSIAFVTCIRYHGNRNGHSTSLGERQKGMTESHKQTKMSFHIVK